MSPHLKHHAERLQARQRALELIQTSQRHFATTVHTDYNDALFNELFEIVRQEKNERTASINDHMRDYGDHTEFRGRGRVNEDGSYSVRNEDRYAWTVNLRNAPNGSAS